MKKNYIFIVVMFFQAGVIAQCSLTLSATTNVTCYGGTDGYATVSPTGTPPYSYSWSPGGHTDQAAISLSIGSYTVTMTDANSCVATTVVTITEPPQLNITISTTNPSDSTSCDGSVTASVSGGSPPYTYHWQPGGQTTVSVSGQCPPGAYIFTVTDSHNCTKTDSISIGITGFEELFSSNRISVFPNPSSGQFSILFDMQVLDAKISVVNIMGLEVFQSAITNPKKEIDIQQPNGIYFLYVIKENKMLIRKIVIQE